jgi:hypothetical protein
VYEIYVIKNMSIVTIYIYKQALASFVTLNAVDKKTIKPKKCHSHTQALGNDTHQTDVE